MLHPPPSPTYLADLKVEVPIVDIKRLQVQVITTQVPVEGGDEHDGLAVVVVGMTMVWW
jgi:hypothetical protein